MVTRETTFSSQSLTVWSDIGSLLWDRGEVTANALSPYWHYDNIHIG